MKKSILFLPLALILAGCVTSEYYVRVNPSGARINVTGQPPAQLVQTPDGLKVQFSSKDMDYTISASQAGYATANYTIRPGTKLQGPITLELQPLFYDKTFEFASLPAGAEVFVDGKLAGKTPLSRELRFNRGTPQDPWDRREITVKLPEWQTETTVVSASDSPNVSVQMARLHHARAFRVTVVTTDGQPLDAPVSIDGQVVGTAPMTIPLVFERPDKSQPWPSFTCSAGIRDEYREAAAKITRDSPDSLTLTLEPVTEMGVKRMMPTVLVGPRGAQYIVDAGETVATVDTRETSGSASELREITGFRRNDHRHPQVNSFAMAPNGQTVVYALTETNDDGSVYSNLWQSPTDITSGARQRLTTGNYLDANPRLPTCDGNQLLVFQSNRGLRDSVDISSITLAEGRPIGGITQITREARFNYAPVLVRQEWELFFVSTEDHYPQAVPQISYMRVDGSSASYMNETGGDLALTPNGRQVFFVRKDVTTGRFQIYSMPMEGYPLTQVISQEAFNNANCFSPAINPEGTMMLFASDMAQDASGRRNSDIYLMNLTNGRIVPVTENASDDIMPAWSPVEQGVVYFLSNRGGTYNIWRLRISEAHK